MSDYPFLQARHYYQGRQGAQPIWIVLHSAESLERHDTAENIARYFSTTSTKASAHLSSDDNSTVRSVRDHDTAFGAKHANNLGLHIEHAGEARQTAMEWLDTFSTTMLTHQSAPAVARWCREYNIPPRYIDHKLLLAHQPGITTHAQVSRAFPSSGHWDPGPHFPIGYYINVVRQLIHPQDPVEDGDMPVLIQFRGSNPQGITPDPAGLHLLSGRVRSQIQDEHEFWDHVAVGQIEKDQAAIVLDFQSPDPAVRARAIRFAAFKAA